MTQAVKYKVTAQSEIAEFQGLYGSYHVSELLLQKLWLRGAFDTRRAVTVEGESLRILNPGKWNRLGGPDFLRAKIEIGDRVITGDVEVHFRADAWRQHGHNTDPAYDNVVLHVVLFPPGRDRNSMQTSRGRKIPLLVLVDLLWHDLEEYAADDAVAALNGVDPLPLVEKLLELDPEARTVELRSAATNRWRQKVHFAGLRIERLGWNEACHQTALEVLGYRNNRSAMLRVGSAFAYAGWRENAPTVNELLEAASSYWRAQGVRPANHPRQRLLQYQSWMAQRGDWPEKMRRLRFRRLRGLETAGSTAAVRRSAGFPDLRVDLVHALCGSAVTGSRWDTLVTNLIFPFLAADRGDGVDWRSMETFWSAWYPGDIPDLVRKAVRDLNGARTRAPISNGVVQGLLGLQLAHGRAG